MTGEAWGLIAAIAGAGLISTATPRIIVYALALIGSIKNRDAEGVKSTAGSLSWQVFFATWGFTTILTWVARQ